MAAWFSTLHHAGQPPPHRAVPPELSRPGVRTPGLHGAVPPELSSLRVRTPSLHGAVPPELSNPGVRTPSLHGAVPLELSSPGVRTPGLEAAELQLRHLWPGPCSERCQELAPLPGKPTRGARDLSMGSPTPRATPKSLGTLFHPPEIPGPRGPFTRWPPPLPRSQEVGVVVTSPQSSLLSLCLQSLAFFV